MQITYAEKKKNISSAGPSFWDNLPLAMRVTDCLSSFKKQLKTFLFKRAFSLFRFFYNIRTFLISSVCQLFYYYYYYYLTCNVINYYLSVLGY